MRFDADADAGRSLVLTPDDDSQQSHVIESVDGGGPA